MRSNFEAVIGLEVHAQLSTKTKVFCGCSTKFGNEPNINVCPVCLGHPGVLPVLNKKVVEYSALMGMATNCKINKNSVFARKNYFYPDLPKGYQISQFEKPICLDGFIIIKNNNERKKIRIERIHIEEDAGKSIHDSGSDTLLDLNRCGVPLIEIVSKPDITSAADASLYMQKIQQILRYLEICDGNMEEGSLRCDANVSIRKIGEKKLGTKTEIKNMNSFKNVVRAINFEIDRQIELLEDGKKINQQTLLWNADQNKAESMRNKEEADDYRYFPEPDLFPVVIDKEYEENLRTQLPELPDVKLERFITQYQLPEYDAQILTNDKPLAGYFDKSAKYINDYKLLSNWIMVEVLGYINNQNISIKDFDITPKYLAELLNLILDKTISGKIAKEVFADMVLNKKTAMEIISDKNFIQISDTKLLEDLIDTQIKLYPKQVEEYLGGKEKLISFFVGKIMQETKGKANPALLNNLLKNKLDLLKNK
ncbi:MAG: Asp-tRNA(Asn)/Glu-tRNA(Gln) amidotransferase GatCAB subunit B [Ignavibacteriales bacterium CG_4_9_14_3_um_filter_30_11]|nr:MAG: Asp-tRNA(Asn)/Glu-tRNA(Gln) amidotransferase GatCAB subunit B [Ignavibacteriales bacterium CG_4_9_14_3_um_filter_30_11]